MQKFWQTGDRNERIQNDVSINSSWTIKFERLQITKQIKVKTEQVDENNGKWLKP